MVFANKGKQESGPQCSQVVSHKCTNRVRRYLTSVIGLDLTNISELFIHVKRLPDGNSTVVDVFSLKPVESKDVSNVSRAD